MKVPVIYKGWLLVLGLGMIAIPLIILMALIQLFL
jgi:hypothetical protein